MPSPASVIFRFGALLFGCLLTFQSAFAFGVPALLPLTLGSQVARPHQSDGPKALGVAKPVRPIDRPLDLSILAPAAKHLDPGVTALSAEGELAAGFTATDAMDWAAALRVAGDANKKARLGIQVAEWEICRREPARAKTLLQVAIKQVRKDSLDYGLAQYDLAMVECLEGRFERSAQAFSTLLNSKLKGFDHRNAALWQRHAAGCAGYHKSHWDLGIPQPAELDPLCGASSLAMCLKQIGLKHDKARVVSQVYHTGEGSSMRDLVEAAPRLGAVGRFVLAEEEGLRALPKPLVAHVERDHFVAVLETNERGVDYACSDCGPWPGGVVQVTWAQWRAMEADAYLVVTKAGSEVDEAVSALASSPTDFGAEALLNASVSPSFTRAGALYSTLRGKVWQGSTVGGNNPICGGRAGSLQCWLSFDGPQCPMKCSPAKSSDPVNVANGQEEYATPTALEIYNPVGPSVTWRPMYFSLANVTPNGFGSGWTHPYNYRIEGTEFTQAPNGGTGLKTLNYVGPNSAKLHFTINLSSKPTQQNPVITVPVETGFGIKVSWVAESFYPNGTMATSRFDIKGKDGSVIQFETSNTSGVAYPKKISDKVGNWINLNWSTMVFPTIDPYRRNGTTKGLVSITNSAGTTLLTLAYGTGGRISSAADCYGRYVYYTLATYPVTGSAYVTFADELTGVSFVTTNSLPGQVGNEYSYTYQSSGNSGGPGPDVENIPYLRTISINSPTGSGVSTATIYSGGGGLVTQTVDANGYATKYSVVYDQLGHAVLNSTRVSVYTSVTAGAPLIQQSDIYFDGQMNRTKVVDANGVTIENRTFGSANTPYKPSQVVDGNNRTWTYTWDQFGHILTSKTPKNITTTYTYDATSWPFGRLVEVQAGTLLSTQYTYWTTGLVKEVKTPVPGNVGGSTRQTTSYTYDALGNILTVTSPGNAQFPTRTTTLAYGASPKLGQPISVTNSQGKVTNFAYDARGNVTSVTDPLGNSTLASYDILDQEIGRQSPATGSSGAGRATTLVNFSYPGGVVNSVIAYNEAGVQVREVDFAYGKEGELVSRTGSAESASFTYDPAYRTKTLADGLAHTTTYNYDLNGRPTSVAYPGNTGGVADSVTYDTYDAVGNLTQLTDGRGTVKKFHYDDTDGLLTWVEYPGFTGQDVTVTYDTLDRTASVIDSTGTSAWTYDDLGEVLTGTRTYFGLSAKTFTYAYNPDGSRLSLGTPAGTFGYSYDPVGRPTQFAAPAATINYTYLDNGWMSNRRLWSGLVFPTVDTDYTYNPAGLMATMTNKGGSSGAIRGQFTLGYDGAFNLSSLTANVPQGPALQSGTTTFTYDTKDRLTQESSTRFKTGGYTDNFAYDAAGNPTTVWGATRTYGLDNQEFPTTFSYDGNGNETQAGAGSLQFSYDAEDRCTRMGYNGGTDFSAGYRADGLRAWKQSSQTGGVKRYFLYDGSMPLIELDSTGAVAAVNTYGPDGLACRTSGGSTVFYSFDQQGNLSGRTDASGNILTSSGYAAFGYSASFATSQSGSFTDPFGYNAQWGYYFDREHSYYLCGHRYYDHDGGRWLTRDPIGYAGGINLYSYCGQGPVGFADPSGLLWREIFGTVGSWAGATVGTSLAPGPGTFIGSVLGSGIGSALGSWLDGDAPEDIAVNAGSDMALEAVTAGLGKCFKAVKAGKGIVEAEEAAAAAAANAGRRGGPAHKAAVEAMEQAMKDAGHTHIAGGSLPERMVNGRYPDLEFVHSSGDPIFGQVGRGLLRGPDKGLPIARERDAIGDILKGKGGSVIWHPYNHP